MECSNFLSIYRYIHFIFHNFVTWKRKLSAFNLLVSKLSLSCSLSLQTCVYVYIYILTHIHIHTYTHAYIHTHIHIGLIVKFHRDERKLNEFEYVKKPLQRVKAVLTYCLGGQMAPLAGERGVPGLVKFGEKLEKA